MKLRDGIRLAMAVSAEGNKFITETEPFKVVKTDPEHAATLVAAGAHIAFVSGVRHTHQQEMIGTVCQT
jgi:methionyl-tRNA synthetase